MSEFSELIKHLHRVRSYVRGFYLFDWRGRADYDEKSPRTYDNERRRVESIFNEYVRSGRIRSGAADKNEKKTSLAINATDIARNPLYEVWRAKRFTPPDIMLHFIILDTGAKKKNKNGFTKSDISMRVMDIASMENFLWNKDIPSDSSIRDKLNEYEAAGLLVSKLSGKELRYYLAPMTSDDLPANLRYAIDFFSEAAPFGEAGDHIRDEGGWANKFFRFKHHFIAQTLDDEILYDLLAAIKERRRVGLLTEKGPRPYEKGVPCKILVSVQSGRRYIGMTDDWNDSKSIARRLDYIDKVDVCDDVGRAEYEEILQRFEADIDKAWGVSFGMGMDSKPDKPEKIVMTLYIDEENERFVLDRLKREGRKGKVERLEKNVFSYSHEVWDSNEMLPFIMSFIGRIISLQCGKATEKRFLDELDRMTSMYGVGR